MYIIDFSVHMDKGKVKDAEYLECQFLIYMRYIDPSKSFSNFGNFDRDAKIKKVGRIL